MDIRRLSMKDMGLDDYTSKFEHLVRKAGWTRDDQNTVTEFVQGLQRWLALKLIGRAPPLDKHQLTPWIEAAREELTLNEERNAMVGAFGKRNEIVRDSRGKAWKPNPPKKPQKDPDAMEVDSASTTVPKDKRLTEEQRKKYFEEGRCFRCGKQGHIGQNCPDKKKPQNDKKNQGKARTAKIEEVKEEKEEEQDDKNDDSDEDSPPKYTKENKAVIATIKALSTKDQEQIFEYMMGRGF